LPNGLNGAGAVDFALPQWLSLPCMQYRIEVSQSRKGYARVNLPGRVIALEASQHVGPVWLVDVLDSPSAAEGSVTVRADNASDAVWRVAQAAVRAVSELTGSPIEGEIQASPGEI
jgi:hypothetical protein